MHTLSANDSIGFFDSGIGGLNVLRDTIKLLPDENYVYFADTKNVPYGVKPKDTVYRLIDEAVAFLDGLKLKALVMACNTATSVAVAELRKKYHFPIIGMEPAVKPAVALAGGKRILVTATSLTLREEKLENLLAQVDPNNIVDKLPLDKLVTFSENFVFDGTEVEDYLKAVFEPLALHEYEAIVLGCTHFLYFTGALERLLGQTIKIVDGNAGTIRHMTSILQSKNLLSRGPGGKVQFYSSCEPETDPSRISRYRQIIGLE